jgi:hypothetical protein
MVDSQFTNNFIFPTRVSSDQSFTFQDDNHLAFQVNVLYFAYTSQDAGTDPTMSQADAITDFFTFFRKLKPADRYKALNVDGRDQIHHARLFNSAQHKERITITATRDWIVLLLGSDPFPQLRRLKNALGFSKVCYVLVGLSSSEDDLPEEFVKQRLQGILAHHDTA